MTETATATGTNCKHEVKDDHGNLNKCGVFLPRGKPECPNRRSHVWKFKSGFCASGWCEGTQAQDSAGKYVRTCSLWMLCNCDCHAKLDKMFALAEEPRVLIENPKYVRPKNDFHLREILEEQARRSMDLYADEHPPEYRKPINLLEEAPSRHFSDTPSGKRARGQLEYQVLAVCKQFVAGQLEVEILRPATIAQEIDEVEPPSVGAIGAVFDRWSSIGFAVCEKGPVRFTSFTADGLQFGLDVMKDRAKRGKKMATAAAGRSLRRR